MILRFADSEIDLDRVELRRDGEAYPIEPQVFDVLTYLATNRGRLVTKDELLDSVWGDRFVSESALTTRIKSARRAVGDDGTTQAVIRTVHGRGYEFVADLEEVQDQRSAPPSAASAASEAPDLPLALSRLVGRDDDLDRLASTVATHRLVTVVGPGGVGKTSLGYELCRTIDGQFPDGIWPVELVQVTQADAVPTAVATALDLQPQQGRSITDTIFEVLRVRTALLFFDNCEHVIDAISAITDQLLQRAPGVTVVATSREPLAVAGEQLWPVQPLGLVDADDAVLDVDRVGESPAVRLFVERARAADPTFELNADSADDVVEICRQLDGVPLALELAAARVRSLDIGDLADRLGERFRLLKGTRRGADPRHHTLLDTVKWSYDLLDPDDRHLFEQLSVFAGPFDLAAAEAVCDDRGGTIDVLDGLARLVDRSMLGVRRSAAGTRHEVLETLRAYGSARLEDDDRFELHRRHLEHYRSEAARFGAGLETDAEQRWAAEIDVAFANLRAAHRFAIDIADQDSAFGIVAPLVEYAARAMRYELVTWAEQALALADDGHPQRLLLAGFAAYGMFVRGEYKAALDRADSLMADAQETDLGYALVLRAHLNADFSRAEPERVMPSFADHLRLAEASGDTSRLAHSAYFNAVAHASIGRFDEAKALADRAAEAAAQTANPTALAGALFGHGITAERSDVEAALAALERSEATARSVNNRWMATFALTEIASLNVRLGNLSDACSGFAEVVDTWYRAGDWANQWLSLNQAVIALVEGGRSEWAAQVVGAIDTHSMLGALPMEPDQRQRLLDITDGLSPELRAAGADLAIDEVVTRTRHQLVELAG